MINIIEKTNLHEQGKIRLLIEIPSYIDEQFVKNTLTNELKKITGNRTKLNVRDTVDSVLRLFSLEFTEMAYKDRPPYLTARQMIVYIAKENNYTYEAIRKHLPMFSLSKLGSLNANFKRKLINNDKSISSYKNFIKMRT